MQLQSQKASFMRLLGLWERPPNVKFRNLGDPQKEKKQLLMESNRKALTVYQTQTLKTKLSLTKKYVLYSLDVSAGPNCVALTPSLRVSRDRL